MTDYGLRKYLLIYFLVESAVFLYLHREDEIIKELKHMDKLFWFKEVLSLNWSWFMFLCVY